MADDPRNVDELRGRLRQLGYLDAGVDRFVLAPVARGRGLVKVAALSSARIGLLVALLLGPSTAIGLGVRLAGLVTSPRDGVVLALFLGVIFWAATSFVAFLAIWLAGVAISRTGMSARVGAAGTWLGRVAGVSVGAVALAYLVLWWRTSTAPGALWAGAGWTLLALVGAAGISVLLGHTVMLTTLALVARARSSGDQPPERRRSSWSRLLAVWALAAVVAAGLLALAGSWESPRREPSRVALERTKTGARWLVLAVDGFDVSFGDRLAMSGALPALAPILGGARAVLAPAGADPAAAWSSIATGRPADVHGIHGVEARRVSGLDGTVSTGGSGLAIALGTATDLLRLTRPAAVSGLQRRAKTFWEVATEQGVRAVIVNWWASWPALSDGGVVLTDRAALRLDRGGELDEEITPAPFYDRLRTDWPALRARVRREAIESFAGVEAPMGEALRRAAEQDIIHVELFRLAQDGTTDLSTVYLPGLDIAQFALVSGPGASGLPASRLAERVTLLERYYVFLDRLVAPLLATSGADSRDVMLITDPGRTRSGGTGLLAAIGPDVRPDARLALGVEGALSALLYSLGLPFSRQIGGEAASELFTGEFRARVPVRWVPTYGGRVLPAPRAGAQPLDDEATERLRSLGYIR